MLPPPEGGGFVVTDSSPVPSEARLKVSHTRWAEGPRRPCRPSRPMPPPVSSSAFEIGSPASPQPLNRPTEPDQNDLAPRSAVPSTEYRPGRLAKNAKAVT